MFSNFTHFLRALARAGPHIPTTPDNIWDEHYMTREQVNRMVETMVDTIKFSGERAGSKVSLVEGDVTTTLMATPAGFQILVTKGGLGYVNGSFPSAVLYHPTSLTLGYGTGSDPLESRIYWGPESTVIDAPGLRAVFKGYTLHIWSSGADGRFEFKMDASGDDVKYSRIAEFCIAHAA
jgi:hypothetical protein